MKLVGLKTSISINELSETTCLAPLIIVKLPEVVAYLFSN